MFALSCLLLAIAVVSLLLGLSRDGLLLIYVSIGGSMFSIVFVVAAVIRRPTGTRGRSGTA